MVDRRNPTTIEQEFLSPTAPLEFCVAKVKALMKLHEWTYKGQVGDDVNVEIVGIGMFVFHIKHSTRLGPFITSVTQK